MTRRMLRWSDWQLRTKGLAVVSVAVLPLLVVWTLIMVALAIQLLQPSTATSVRSRETPGTARLEAALLEAEAAARDYAATGRPAARARYDAAVAALPELREVLNRPVSDEEAAKGIATIQRGVDAVIAYLAAAIEDPSVDGDAFAPALGALEEVRSAGRSLESRQRELARERIASSRRRQIWILALFLGGTLVCVPAGYVAAVRLARGTRERIKLLGVNAGRLSRGEPLNPMPSGRDEIARLGENLQEASELLRAREATLRQRTTELEAANRELEAFSYSVSHDLRAPLRAIAGFSQAIDEDHGATLDESGRAALRRVRAAATRMGALIDALLTLARITRMSLNCERLDLSAMASSILAEIAQRDPRRAASMTLTVAPDLAADGDPRLMRIALENLLDNAWKYTSKTAAPAIEVGAAPTADGPAFFVRDNGAGFDMNHAGKLFGAFQRLHAERDFEGTGIGLATVQRVIHRHGGQVRAESAVNAGATFYFTLPPAASRD